MGAEQTIDLSRGCFCSFDPDDIINDGAKKYDLKYDKNDISYEQAVNLKANTTKDVVQILHLSLFGKDAQRNEHYSQSTDDFKKTKHTFIK